VKLRLVMLFVAAVALLAPVQASANHHVFIPGGPCGESENSGGNNPTMHDALVAAGVGLPLPPVGTAAPDHSDRISNSPDAECPAPGK
jgi:hypothetical protein